MLPPSASMAWASHRRGPLLRIAVSGSSASSGRRSGTTVVWLIVAYRSFGRFWQARHPPRYAAFLRQPSPSFGHSSLRDGLPKYMVGKPERLGDLYPAKQRPEQKVEAA